LVPSSLIVVGHILCFSVLLYVFMQACEVKSSPPASDFLGASSNVSEGAPSKKTKGRAASWTFSLSRGLPPFLNEKIVYLEHCVPRGDILSCFSKVG
jgi:hypothetical protein